MISAARRRRNDAGHVICGFLVNSVHSLEPRAGFRGRSRPAADDGDEDDDYLYVVYETDVDEPDWAARATLGAPSAGGFA